MLSVSVEPDLVEATDPILKSPKPVISSLTDESLDVADDPPLPVLVMLICILPPALKNQRAWLAFENVTDCSTVCDPVHLVDDAEVCRAAEVVNAVALGDPPATQGGGMRVYCWTCIKGMVYGDATQIVLRKI